MEKLLTAVVFSFVLATLNAGSIKKNDWIKYGNCDFSPDSIDISVTAKQKTIYSMVISTKPLEVKPSEIVIIRFKAKGSGKFRIILYLSHSKRKSTYGGPQKNIVLNENEFEDHEVKLTVPDEKAYGSFAEKCSVAFMAFKKGSNVIIKNVEIKKAE